jgi:hypothetical protein
MAPEVVIAIAFILGGVLVGYLRGGPPERTAATIIVAWVVSDVTYTLMFGSSTFDAVDPARVLLDGGELVAITWVALRANRMWPLWAAAAQLICVSGHLAALIEVGGMKLAYWALTQVPAYIQLTALVFGALAHARRFDRIGPYRSWRYSPERA